MIWRIHSFKKPQVFFIIPQQENGCHIGNVSSVDVMRVKMDGNGDSAFGSAGGDNEDALISSQPTPPPP